MTIKINRRVAVRSLALIGVVGLVAVGIVALSGRSSPINSRLDLAIGQSAGQDDQLTGTLEIILDDKALASFAAIGEYEPAAAMTDIIDHLDLADGGRWLINENQPELISRVEMAKLCGPKAFGCFVGYKDQSGQPVGSSIAIVRDLPHKQAVEALAHELLHGAYHHLDGFNLDQVNGWIDAAYSDNQDSLDHRLEPYGQQTAGSRYHELHSFVGTIVDDLPADFETHYRQYFNNRALIVGHAPDGSHDDPGPDPARTPAPADTSTEPTPPAQPEPPAPQPDPEPTPPSDQPDLGPLTPDKPAVRVLTRQEYLDRLISSGRGLINYKRMTYEQFGGYQIGNCQSKGGGGPNGLIFIQRLSLYSEGEADLKQKIAELNPDEQRLFIPISEQLEALETQKAEAVAWAEANCSDGQPKSPTTTQSTAPTITAQEGDMTFSLAGRWLTASLNPAEGETEAPTVISWNYLYWPTEAQVRSNCTAEQNEFGRVAAGTQQSLSLANRHLGNWFCFRATDENSNEYYGVVGIAGDIN